MSELYLERNRRQLVYIHAEVLGIIETTVHGFGTHHATTAAKYTLMRFCRRYAEGYMDNVEHAKVRDAMKVIYIKDTVGQLSRSQNSDVTLSFLIDLVTHILYAKGVDVWEVLNTPNWRYNCV